VLSGSRERRLVADNVPQRPPSSIGTEIGWLFFFLALFAGFVYLFVGFLLVPHHFNDKIAIVLAALAAGLVMIGVRAKVSSQWRRD
jgi:hypothetical protein